MRAITDAPIFAFRRCRLFSCQRKREQASSKLSHQYDHNLPHPYFPAEFLLLPVSVAGRIISQLLKSTLHHLVANEREGLPSDGEERLSVLV